MKALFRSNDKDSLDFYPTAPWATRALFEYGDILKDLKGMRVWEVASGKGHMSNVIKEYIPAIRESDIYKYKDTTEIFDFLDQSKIHPNMTDWVITNPPFNKAQEFVHNANIVSKVGYAMILRLTFLESKKRYEDIFSKNRPSKVLVFSERVSFSKGSLTTKTGNAVAYAWFIWYKNRDTQQPTIVDWIPPCKNILEKRVDNNIE